MILGAEVVLIILGLIGLVGGWFPGAGGRSVRGIHARFLGLIALLPLPVAYAIGFLSGFALVTMGMTFTRETAILLGMVIDISVLGLFVALISYLGHRWSDPSKLTLEAKPEPFSLDDEAIFLDEPADATSSGMARASLMLGIFSLLTSILASIPAFILGGIALARIGRSGGRIAGKGAAVAGIVLGIIGTFTGTIALALLIPFLKHAADPGPANVPAPQNFAVKPVENGQPSPTPTPTPTPNPTPKPDPSPTPPPVIAKAEPKTKPGARISSKPRSSRTKAKTDRPNDSKPETSTGSLASKPRKVGDLKVTDLKVEAAKVPRCLVWGDEGKVVFILETDGTLRRVAVDGFVEERKWEIGQKCSWLSVSSEGLVLTVNGMQEVWLLDPKTFDVKTKTSLASVTRAESSIGSRFAFATAKQADVLDVIDLKTGEVVHEYDSRSLPGQVVGFAKLVVAPDGKSFFAEGMEKLIRFDFDGDELTFGGETDRIAQNGKAIEISDDGAYVALPSGGGNYGKPPYTTSVYKTSNLSEPEIKLTSGAYPQALGFDLKAGYFYAQNSENSLILFQPTGIKAKAYNLAVGRGNNSSPRQFLVHPEGGKLLVLSDSMLAFVELPEQK